MPQVCICEEVLLTSILENDEKRNKVEWLPDCNVNPLDALIERLKRKAGTQVDIDSNDVSPQI